MLKNYPIGYSLRMAVVRKVSRTFVECQYLGHTGEPAFKCPTPHPYVSKGAGMLAGIEVGSIVITAKATAERKFILAFLPDRSYNFDQSGIENSDISVSTLPELQQGELYFRAGSGGPYIDMTPDGQLVIEADAGRENANLELSSRTKTMFTRVDNRYEFTESGRYIDGVIKRDLSEEEEEDRTDTVNFLSGEEYDFFLTKIGRSPEDEVQSRSTTFSRQFVRNPALVEKRSITYEYADSFGVTNVSKEAAAGLDETVATVSEKLVRDPSDRNNRRTDILNLGMFNYNHLIEKVEGTVVDIYGNILDINRNIINVPDASTLDIRNGAIYDLQNVYRHLRRSVKYHMEINARKEIYGDEPGREGFTGTGKEHGRWSVDVDGEGLTKINIPASSNTGNIPVFGRYITSIPEDPDLRNSGKFRDSELTDIRMLPFGYEGPTINNSEYLPKTFDGNISSAGTPYHDLTNIASSIFSSGKFRNTNPGPDAEAVPPINSKIDNRITDDGSPDANAGGKSVSANLDGSLELAIGADNIDGKSLVLDLEGGVVSHYGRDKNGRSIIHQTDGDVLIQIGGKGSSTSDVQLSKDGSLEIHLSRGSGPSQKIIIDSQGITIDVQGNAVFSATGDLTLSAGGRLLMGGEVNFMYGTHDSSIDGTRAVQGTERLVLRNGIPNHL